MHIKGLNVEKLPEWSKTLLSLQILNCFLYQCTDEQLVNKLRAPNMIHQKAEPSIIIDTTPSEPSVNTAEQSQTSKDDSENTKKASTHQIPAHTTIPFAPSKYSPLPRSIKSHLTQKQIPSLLSILMHHPSDLIAGEAFSILRTYFSV